MVPNSDEAVISGKDIEATMALPKVAPIEVNAVKSETPESKVESKSDNGKSTSTSKNGKGKNDSRSKAESNKADKNKEFDGETFSADPNSPEQTQSSLLNAISESIQGVGSNSSATEAALEAKANKDEDSQDKNAENASKPEESKGSAKMDKLRRFDPDSLINRDEEYALGNFTFFEPLTGQTAGDEAAVHIDPNQIDSSATAEFVPDDAAAHETQEAAANAAAISGHEEEQAEPDTSVKAEAETAETSAVTEISATAESEAIETADKSAEITGQDENSTTTLDKFAEIVGEASSPSDAKKADEERLEKEERVELSKVIGEIQPNQPNQNDQEGSEIAEVSAETSQSSQEEKHTNGAKSAMSTVIKSSGVVPNWCKKYFSGELGNLSKELNELNEQVKATQQKIQDVQSRVALTRGLRNVLLSSQGEELVEGCSKVLSMNCDSMVAKKMYASPALSGPTPRPTELIWRNFPFLKHVSGANKALSQKVF
jgi:sulfur transfer protein SufE